MSHPELSMSELRKAVGLIRTIRGGLIGPKMVGSTIVGHAVNLEGLLTKYLKGDSKPSLSKKYEVEYFVKHPVPVLVTASLEDAEKAADRLRKESPDHLFIISEKT